MEKKLLCIFFLPLNIIATYGQSNVWEMPTVSIDTSIVRYWNQDKYFVYMVTQSGTKSFEFHDNVSNITYGANLDPQVTINDFQIGHDSIFAGGTVNLSGEKYGLLACFSINDFLSGYSSANYLIFQSSASYFSSGFYNTIVEVKRIALYEYENSIRIAYIADNHINHQPNYLPVAYYRSGYGDAAFLSTGWDVCNYYLNKDGTEVFTDICTTESKILMTGPSCDSSLLKFQVFNKMRDFVQPYYSTHTIHYGFTDHRVLGKVMASHLFDDLVSLAYHYSDGTQGGLCVKTIDCNIPPVLLTSLEITEDTSNYTKWHMNDIRFDPVIEELLVLNKIEDPLSFVNSYVFQLGLPIAPTGTGVIEYIFQSTEIQSMDLFGPSKFITSGVSMSASPILFNNLIGTPTTCGVYGAAPVSTSFPKLNGASSHHHVTVLPFYTYGSYPLVITNKTINTICQ